MNARVGPVLVPAIQIGLGGLEGLEAQALQRRPLRVADAGFDFAFPIGVADATRQRDGAVVREHVAIERIERRVVDVGREHALFEVIEHDDGRGAAEPAEGALVQLTPRLRARSPRQQADGFPRVRQREEKESGAAVLAGLGPTHHRALAVIDLALFARTRGDDDARLGRRGAAQFCHEATDACVLRGEAVILDEILLDGHRIAAAGQRLVNQLAIGLAGARTRRSTGPRRQPRVGGHLARGGRLCRRVGGHLPGNCRFWWTFAWPTAAADGNPRRAQVLADRDAMHARRAADARQRPPQATERENFLLFVWLQDVAHGREGLHVRRRRQRLGRRQLIVGFEVSTNCRFWVSAEAGVRSAGDDSTTAGSETADPRRGPQSLMHLLFGQVSATFSGCSGAKLCGMSREFAGFC